MTGRALANCGRAPTRAAFVSKNNGWISLTGRCARVARSRTDQLHRRPVLDDEPYRQPGGLRENDLGSTGCRGAADRLDLRRGLLVVAWTGSLLLKFFGISVDSLRTAGGVIVLVIGLHTWTTLIIVGFPFHAASRSSMLLRNSSTSTLVLGVIDRHRDQVHAAASRASRRSPPGCLRVVGFFCVRDNIRIAERPSRKSGKPSATCFQR